jgi:sec-independent protein translocase protein TatC
VVNAKMLARNRKYAILGAFVVAAVLTPTPDIFNQTLMAGPLIILYEVGIISARLFGRRRAAAAPPASSNGQPPDSGAVPSPPPATPADQPTVGS